MSTVWLLLTLPLVLCLLGIVVESGNLWLARVELTTALESAALAGVDHWGDLGANNVGNRMTARQTAVDLAAANQVVGHTAMLAPNHGGALPNNNASYTGNVVILGAYNPATRQFDGTVDPAAAGYDRAVHAQATVSVDSIIGSFCGVNFSAYDITTRVTARYNGGNPALVRVDSFIP